MIMANTFKNQMIESWETPGNANALVVAKQSGAELHPVKGDCTVAEFMDGSFALVANHGNAILCTWLEEDVK